ncbi:hypothetical protein DICPUDRAFT_77048 [Dictyostelium purpureum]|uniref:Uncharacterized protein n=1 Tax=Dictyostelium purpureum TaxID=5786 RepID=F0ZFF9_DICPU|nr:uncharacterized protein DICPUDRAFT_77048 [Dictyostelium purpureum]EGC37330.1 hypothetical protein DICPUDRAFT_77048 [Dictyostelium purpureum]|eukprot:XP_003286144.1 hypothetical protein DICPUDRAFT_77048 [Dictyostelium purpureum]
MSDIIKTLLSPKEFKKCNVIFDGSERRFKKEWSCFNQSNSWVQLFHDIIILCNGVRSSVLIDYMVPEWEDLVEFLEYLKSKSELVKCLPNLTDIQIIFLDDFLFFLVNKAKLNERAIQDQSTSFSNYLFIDVSPSNENPQLCNNSQYHIKLLNNLISVINNNNNNNTSIKLNNHNDILELNKNYYPIISGWLCEYPIIYCNSGYFQNCISLNENLNNNTINIDQLNKDWENNNLGGDELIKIQVQLEEPINQFLPIDILKVQSIVRICAFTCPQSLFKNVESYLSNYEQRILERFQNSTFKNYWKNIKFIKDVISNPSIRL